MVTNEIIERARSTNRSNSARVRESPINFGLRIFQVSFDASSIYPPAPYVPLLDWKSTLHNLPWGIVLLLGGGFAIAEGCKTSCLSHWLGEQFTVQ